VQYIVQSGGRPIGVTDLAFARWDDHVRSGWLHPNEEGERVLPRATTSVHDALYALRQHFRRHPAGESHRREALLDSPEFADYTEALHHADALDLTLHLANGALVPTEFIGVQDCDRLVALYGVDADDDASEAPCDPETMARIEREVEEMLEGHPAMEREPWMPEEEPTEFPRYQIHLRLLDPADVP
jgi:hypothetical protein